MCQSTTDGLWEARIFPCHHFLKQSHPVMPSSDQLNHSCFIDSWAIINCCCFKLLNLGKVFFLYQMTTKWHDSSVIFIYNMIVTFTVFLHNYNTIHSTISSKGKKYIFNRYWKSGWYKSIIFHDTNIQQTRNRREFLKLIKGNYVKPLTNITPNNKHGMFFP